MSDTEGAQDDIQAGAAARVNNSGNVPWCTTVGPLGDTLGDDHEGEGGPEGGVSVAGDREAGGSVTLTKERNRRWKNRQEQRPSTKQSPGRTPGL